MIRKNDGSAVIEAIIISQLLILIIIMLVSAACFFCNLALDRAVQDSEGVAISASWSNAGSEPLYWRLSAVRCDKRLNGSDADSLKGSVINGFIGQNAVIYKDMKSAISIGQAGYRFFSESCGDGLGRGSRFLLQDNAEFIRNTDFACDVVTELMNHPFIQEAKAKLLRLYDNIRRSVVDGSVPEDR